MNLHVAPFLGLRWCERGNSFAGVDCVGLVDLIYRTCFGIDEPSLKPVVHQYTYGPKGIRAASENRGAYLNNFVEVSPAEVKPGDLVVLKTYGVAGHMGVVVEPGLFLHVERAGFSYVDRYTSGRFTSRIDGFFRHRDLVKVPAGAEAQK